MSNWAFVCLSEILTESKIIDNCPDPDRKIRVKLNCNGVEKRPLMSEKEGATKNYVRKSGQFIYGKQNFHKGAFGVIPTELDGFSSSGDLPAFDVDSRCLPEWIYYWFKTDNRYLQLAKHAKGVGSQRVNVDSFLKEEIALPSLNLQAKIIGNINNSSFTLKSLSVESQNQSSYLTKLRQAILQEAIEGKLTADWRKENPVRMGDPDFDAEALLEKIQAEKEKLIKEGKIKKQKPLAPIKAEEVPFELPEGWVWTRLGEMIFYTDNLDIQKKLSPSTIINYVDIDSIDNKLHQIKEYKIKTVSELSSRARRVLKKGYIAYSTVRPYLENIAFIENDIENGIGSTGLNVFKSIKNNSFYVFNFLLSPYINNKYKEMMIGFNSPSITNEQFENTYFPLPPLAEQQAIVDRVEKLLSMVDELEKQVSERKEQSEQLMQAVLREAFEGGK